MKGTATILALLSVCAALGAASLDERTIMLPDKQASVVITGGKAPELVFRDVRGKSLYSTRDAPDFRDVFEFYSEHVLWSPDSRVVAIAAGYPQHMRTYIFVRQGASFVHVRVPTLADGYDNPWITPIEWLKNRTLRLKISGPHAGKARDSGYRGEARVRITIDPPKCEEISKHITEYDDNNT